MRLPVRGPAALLLVTALVSCTSHSPSSTSFLDDAARESTDASSNARTQALAGFHAYLVQGDSNLARARFNAALQRDANEPYALYGQLLLARREGQLSQALNAGLDLTRRAPTHPLSVVAARFVLDGVGLAPEIDERILKGTETALQAGASAEAAQLLRSAQVAIRGLRGERTEQAQSLTDMGAASSATLVGPFSPYQILAADLPTAPERDGSLVGPWSGPYGPLKPRTLVAPDGRLRLAGEPSRGDVFLLALDVDVLEEGLYLVRSVSQATQFVFLDGAPLLERRAFERSVPVVTSRPIRLSAGKHRVLLRVTHERDGALSFALPRADGRPSRLRITPAQGPAPRATRSAPLPKTPAVPLSYPSAAELNQALLPEAGEALANFIAIRDGMGRDRDGAKRLMDRLSLTVSTPPVLVLRAELAAADRSVPPKVATGRANRDLEAALAKDPKDTSAWLLRAEISLDEGQAAAAQQSLKEARATQSTASFPLLLREARVALALNIESQAETRVEEALQLQPDLCEARLLRYDLARRRDALSTADAQLPLLERCPGALHRKAEHARLRGQKSAAVTAYQQLLEREPGNLNVAFALTEVLVGERRFDEARKLLTSLRELWPRNAALVKRLADVVENAGQREEALALREAALLLEGDDLTLRRAVHRARTGQELLQAHAIDGKKALADYRAAPGEEDSAAAYVLDAAAVQVYPDGSSVSRVHIIQKALEPSGVPDIAEVDVPPGAQVLALRTLKADGTVLEPESIEGKDSVSLPGVQVGDAVESEYLLAEASRGPAQPGFTASAFYFQIAGQPNNWSTYTVVAPKGSGMRVDDHRVKSAPPVVQGEQEVFFHEERRVPPAIPEPDAPPSGNETLPFVQVGAGALGNDGVVAAYADAFLSRGTLTYEVERFAREATEGRKGLDAVKALFQQVMKQFGGRDAGLSQSAAATVSQDRGSRLWVLKAGLESLGFRTRLVAVRTFTVDPKPYLFPNESLLPYVCLRVEVPGAQPIWLDTLFRWAPFNALPEVAAGGREAYLLPEPGRPLEQVRTPAFEGPRGKRVQLSLQLTADGKLQGEGEEIYEGFEAAQLGEAFEQLSAENRDQALQGSLSRYFGGAELSSVKLTREAEVGAPFTLRYRFAVPQFARQEGDGRLALGPLTFPASLGRRYVQLGARKTPLYIDGTEASQTRVTLKLPAGFTLFDPQASVEVSSPFGHLRRKEQQQGDTVTINESFHLPMSRVAPERYDAFAQFAGQVDLLQSRDLFLVPARLAAARLGK